jgi:hypothetical protein
VVSIRHDLPSSVPVRFWLIDDNIHFRASSGDGLENALARAIVGSRRIGESIATDRAGMVMVHGRLVDAVRPDKLRPLGIADDPFAAVTPETSRAANQHRRRPGQQAPTR